MSMRPPAGYNSPAGAWVAQYVKDRFGRETLFQESNPTIGTTPVEVLKGNPRRFSWLIFNLSTGNVFIGFSKALSTVNGAPLQPLGGGVSVEADEDGELPTSSVWAVASAAASQLYVLEVVGV